MTNQIESRATHLAQLNIWNEQGTYNMWVERSHELLDENTFDIDDTIYELAKEMKDFYEDGHVYNDYVVVYSDLLQWAIACVDWTEIAEYLREDMETYVDDMADELAEELCEVK
jgi:hypothetical protein